jgi:cytoskeleton protein RodZ
MPPITWAIHPVYSLRAIARVPAIAGGIIWLFHVKPGASVLGMDLKENRKTDEKDDTVEPETASGLGSLLKEGREKKGLNYEEMAQITKLRAYALEALENEAWHLLPPPVFVKGFIKSYAKALGLGESRLLDLYQETLSHDAASSPQMISPPKRTKKGLIFVLIVLFVLSAVSVNLWMGKPSSDPATDQIRKEPPSKMPRSVEEKAEPLLLRDGPEYPANKPAESVYLSETEAAPALQGASTPDLEPVQQDRLELLGLKEGPDESATKRDSLTAPVTISPAVTELLVLTGRVYSETYVKMYVDDQAPKEYMFKPGSRPQWEAKKGFYVMVGNASGIEFDLNGREYRDFGRDGEVVRLRFPENFKRQILEE